MVGLMRVSAGVKNREDPRLLQLLQPVTVTVDDAVSSRPGVGYPGPVSRPFHDANARRRPSTGPAQTELEHPGESRLAEQSAIFERAHEHARPETRRCDLRDVRLSPRGNLSPPVAGQLVILLVLVARFERPGGARIGRTRFEIRA